MGRFVLVAEILICGVFFLFVTTDTARLWSAPHGTKLYDSKFRKEQLIITSTHPQNTGYHRFPDGKWIPFGPIFHLELLNQASIPSLVSTLSCTTFVDVESRPLHVTKSCRFCLVLSMQSQNDAIRRRNFCRVALDLQNVITSMKVPFEGSNITLEDICFQPLAPQTKKCAIQSIFQYFQNNKTKLNKCLTSMGFNCSDPDVIDFRAADFHDHLLFCTEYPASPFDEKLQLPCLGAFGGPVDPNITLAGFTGTAYKNASTMIITYVVNNYQDESKLAEVMAWENAFIKYMEALDLQNDITNMKVPFEGSNITLEDICFQPLAPQTKKCAIQSIFQYFQNNKTRLNKCLTSMGFNCSDPDVIDFRAADFHDHLLFCTEYPASPFDERLQEPCLGAFGGPVDPNITLAGFTGTAYKNASTMIITYVVNNYQDESKLAEVMAWEKVFIKYMEAYTNDSSHANLTIKYFTPGSIERLYGIEM
ncbi:hypothetical protein ACROYT_G030363 [Oculina patagonica]